jgi:hypothetical protein
MPTSFEQDLVPQFWSDLLPVFGITVDYYPQAGGGPFTIDAIWKEGVEDEPTSPGIYSHIWIENSSLISIPVKGDTLISEDNFTYQVDRVDATAVGVSKLILKEKI